MLSEEGRLNSPLSAGPSQSHSGLSTEALLIPTAELSALVEVKWPEWRGGGQEGLGRPTGGSFNKSLAGDGASSFQVAVQSPQACGGQSSSVAAGTPGMLGTPGTGQPPHPRGCEWDCARTGRGSRGLLSAGFWCFQC